MILPAGSFKVSDYRKDITNKVKLAVIAREFDFDHDPALVRRDYDTEAGDFIPPQLDPSKIVARKKAEHNHKTFGRKPDAERTVTTRDSDVGEAKRTRRIRRNAARHDAVMLAKGGGDETPRRERKHRIPSRPFDKAHRPLRGKSSFGRRQ